MQSASIFLNKLSLSNSQNEPIYVESLTTLLYYSGPGMLARSEWTAAPRHRDVRVGVDPAGLY